MKRTHYNILLFFLAFLVLLGFENCTTEENNSLSKCTPCGVGCASPTFNYDLPKDVGLLNQQCVNALSWQTFIALTWNADANNAGQPNKSQTISDYGKPGDLTPMVWETYKDVEEVFTVDPSKKWGDNHDAIMREHLEEGCQGRRLVMTHKFHKNDDAIINEFLEAGGRNLWITDQNGNLIWSEIKINKIEFDYIMQNDLYDPVKQLAISKDKSLVPRGIVVPNNSIELKASWRVIPDDQFEKLKGEYKIIKACVPSKVEIDSVGASPRVSDFEEKYMGLVGLHIINKLPKTPQFIWATFEHKDLAPLDNQPIDPNIDYLLFDKSTPDAPYNVATSNSTDVTKPTQIKKVHLAEPSIEAKALNAWVKESLDKLAPNSVFRNYHLVNVQWPSSAVADGENIIPLSEGGMTPLAMTNVTLETYTQEISCLHCHVNASISTQGLTVTEEEKKYSADYSFVFGRAVPQPKK